MEQQSVSNLAAEPKEKALRALTTAETFLEAASREIPSIAAKVRSGQHDDAAEQLRLLLGGLDSLARLAVDLESVLRTPAQAEQDLDLVGLKTDLAEMVAQQENQNWDGVAKVIENSIGPRITPWKTYFREKVETLRLVTPAS